MGCTVAAAQLQLRESAGGHQPLSAVERAEGASGRDWPSRRSPGGARNDVDGCGAASSLRAAEFQYVAIPDGRARIDRLDRVDLPVLVLLPRSGARIYRTARLVLAAQGRGGR